MRANRLVHALEPINNAKWKGHYSRIREHPAGIPCNILLPYHNIWHKIKNDPVRQAEVIRDFREEVAPDGLVLIDNGVYTLKNQLGLSAAKGEAAGSEIIGEGHFTKDTLLPYLEQYTDFLVAANDWWDYAFDFDCEQLIGAKAVDEFHEIIVSRGNIERHRLIRSYHNVRPNVNQWWDKLCVDDRYIYVAIEGGNSHNRDPNFYRPLTDIAHQHGKLVHIFAATTLKMMQEIPADTFDSASYLIGGRFGEVITPVGNISFADRKTTRNDYYHLETAVQEQLREH